MLVVEWIHILEQDTAAPEFLVDKLDIAMVS